MCSFCAGYLRLFQSAKMQEDDLLHQNKNMNENDEWVKEMETDLKDPFCIVNDSNYQRVNEKISKSNSLCPESVPIEVGHLANNFHAQVMEQTRIFTEMVFQQKELNRESTIRTSKAENMELEKARLVVRIQSLVAMISNKLHELQLNSS